MRHHAPRLLPFLLPPIFALVAFIFSVLTITSTQWTLRNNYDESLLVSQWKTPIYTLSRSPFAICSAVANVVNGTTSYSISCQHFRPYGTGKTSCEALLVTQDDSAANTGDARLCQQIHFAGNFAIASTTFITMGFCLTGILLLGSLLTSFSSGAGETRGERADNELNTAGDRIHESKSHFRGHRHTFAPYINLLAVTFLVIGAILGVISQFYGILGFIQSAPNNAEFAGAGSTDTSHGSHGPWFEGPGLSRYCTLAWAFSLVGGLIALGVWRLPRWEKVL